MTGIDSIEACAAAIAAIGAIDRDLAAIERGLQEAAARAKAAAETRAGPLNEARAGLSSRVEAFCAARRANLIEGDGKSIRFATGEAGWRLGQARLEIDPKRLKDILTALNVTRLKHLLRFSDPEIDKRAVLKEPKLIKGVKGLKIVPAEESFWVKPVALDLAEGPAAA